VSALLDVAMELPGHARAHWLASLHEGDPEAAGAVASWLDELAAMESTGFLETRVERLPDSAAAAGVEVGAYRLVAPIGQGGMGTVWLAERSDGQFEQRAAVKLLNVAWLGSHAGEHFAREATILARLTHPQIAHLLDACITPAGTPYLVLEHVDGEHIDRHWSTTTCRSWWIPSRPRLTGMGWRFT
jgi:serine/threonine-protein kinase